MNTLSFTRIAFVAARLLIIRSVGTAVAAGAGAMATDHDALLAWTDVLTEVAADPASALPPHLEARVCAMTSLAMELAILGLHESRQSLGADDAQEHAAAATAAHEVLRRVWPAAALRMAEAVARHAAAVAAEVDRARAFGVGRTAAAEVLERREHDRWCEMDSGAVAAAASTSTVVAEPGWKSPWLAALPFVLKDAAQFRARLPYWTNMDGALEPDTLIMRARVFDKVDHTTPGAMLAQFWSGSPVVSWNRIAQAVASRAALDLATRARALAVVNVAMADATLAALHEQSALGR